MSALPVWSACPFGGLLLSIPVLQLTAPRWWESNRNKALVAALWAVPVAAGLAWDGPAGRAELARAAGDYGSLLALLTALYVVSGGIALTGDIRGRPRTNVAFLAAGAVLANLVGTTGAALLLIRPLLRTNSQREHVRHIPVFFIFVVCNTGGLLTPLGDPPLYLGYERGVDFFWTLRLWPQWAIVNGTLLAAFFVWDVLAYRREAPEAVRRDAAAVQPLWLSGWRLNGPLLLVILLAVIGKKYLPGPTTEVVLAVAALASWRWTPAAVRAENRFNWDPIVEVAVLFAGIFVTMAPALLLLGRHAERIGLTSPAEFFWVTGLLSSVLDNAPTYLTTGTLAAGAEGDLGRLAADRPAVLAAVSCGAVFMGANTYIGNGPNLLVRAIAEHDRFPIPSFLGYTCYAVAVLLPVFVATQLVFFP